MQNSPVFGHIDLFAVNIASMRRRRPEDSAKCVEEANGLAGDAVLRIVEIETDGLHGEAFAALRILGEELPEV